MKVSIIIPTYRDIQALHLILDALKKQTYKNFEVIVAEDDDSKEVKDFLISYTSEYDLIHFSQEDDGNRKAKIINTALSQLISDYVIFIDGDTIPFSTFVESHVLLSEEKVVLCGRRINLGDKVSNDLRKGKVKSTELENIFINYRYLKNDNSRHIEQGIRFKPKSFLYQLVRDYNKNVHIVGSNFSCYRNDIILINGFDEDIVGGSKDDVDLEWRLIRSGDKLKICKYSANLFHLNHTRSDRKTDEEIAKKQMKKNQNLNRYICIKGIIK